MSHCVGDTGGRVGDAGGYTVGSDQSSRKMVAMSGHQMEGCTGLSIGTYNFHDP